jgi:hypothetical protein
VDKAILAPSTINETLGPLHPILFQFKIIIKLVLIMVHVIIFKFCFFIFARK